MKRPFTRRSFLQLAAAIGVTACADDAEVPSAAGEANDAPSGGTQPDGGSSNPPANGPEPEPEPVPGIDIDAVAYEESEFPYGVMAGDATSTQAMLWTKFTGTAESQLFVQVEEVGEGGGKGKVLVSRPVAAGERAANGFVHVDAARLTAGARLRYAFYVVEGDKPTKRSPIGRVRTALAAGALEVITFGGTSCTHQNGAPYPVLADAAKKNFDFFVHGGDHVYCDAGDNAVTLAQYRAKYAAAWGQPGMKALHGSTGMLTTWDDHEFLNNWNPETFNAARRNAAFASFYEHRAIRRNTTAPNRVWRNFVWGNTLEILVLDARSERKPSTRNAANAQFISPAQMAWLKERLTKSTAVFKFIVTSVPITNFPASAAGEADKWEGYPAQRNEILDFIQTQALKGVWWLSGDLHFGSIGGIGTSGPRLAMREVLMGPGGTTARDDISLSATQFDRVVMEKNYTSFRVDPIKKELTVEFLGAGGKSIFKKTYPA